WRSSTSCSSARRSWLRWREEGHSEMNDNLTPERLFHRDAQPAELLIRGAQVLDPRADIDEPHDVLVRDGRIAELGAAGSLTAPADAETVDASGKHLFPGFVDPHVHLRTPGEEYKENFITGTASAAAGGF